MRDGHAERVPMRIGHAGSGPADVPNAEPRNERVIVFPPDALRGGMRVRCAH